MFMTNNTNSKHELSLINGTQQLQTREGEKEREDQMSL